MFQSSNWREVLKIMKLCVMRSSTLADIPASLHVGTSVDMSAIALAMVPHTSFAEAELMIKKELPGRLYYIEKERFRVGIC